MLMKHKRPATSDLFEPTGMGRSLKTYIPATIMYRGISLGRGVALAWLLAQQAGQYALLVVAMQVINIVAPLVSLGLNEAITRYVSQYESQHRLRGFLKFSTKMVLAVTIVATVILLAVAGPFGKYLFEAQDFSAGQARVLTRSVVLAIAAIVFYFLVVAVLKGLRMFPALALMELVHGTLFLAFSVLAILLISAEAENVIWAYLVAMLLPAILCGVGVTRKLSTQADQMQPLDVRGISQKLLWFGSWTAMGGIIWHTWQIYSLWYLRKTGSPVDSDALAAAQLIGQMILIIGAALHGIIMTSIYKVWEGSSPRQASDLLDLYSKLAVGALLVMSLVIVLARHLIVLILPRQFGDAAAIMPQVVLFFQLRAALGFLVIHFALLEKTRLTLWCWLAGLVTNVVLGVFWIVGTHALAGAVHAAVWACVPALCVCLILIRAEGQSISRGLVLLLLISPLIVLPAIFALPALIVVILAACVTGLIFETSEKAMVLERLRGLPIVRRMTAKH